MTIVPKEDGSLYDPVTADLDSSTKNLISFQQFLQFTKPHLKHSPTAFSFSPSIGRGSARISSCAEDLYVVYLIWRFLRRGARFVGVHGSGIFGGVNLNEAF